MEEPKKKLNRSDLTSFLAFILSIAALAIGIIEARIMSQQQETMVQQQKAAVWPYLELRGGIRLTDSLFFESVAENKGVGPAVIKSMSVLVNGQAYTDILDFTKAMNDVLGVGQFTITRFGISQTKSVYKPGESKRLLEVQIYNKKAFLDKIGYIPVHVTYCSIYDECWRENGADIDVGE